MALITSMLAPKPQDRATAKSALASSWIQQAGEGSRMGPPKTLALGTLGKLKTQSQLRKAVLSYATSQELQREEDNRLRMIFETFDTDNDGYISMADITMGYQTLYGDADRAQVQTHKLMLAVQPTQNGLLTCSDFLIANLKLRQAEQDRRLQEAFNRAANVCPRVHPLLGTQTSAATDRNTPSPRSRLSR